MAWVLLIDEDFRCFSLFGIQPWWLYLCHALSYLEPKHGLLASTFKVLIGLPPVILLARFERTGYDEEYVGDEHAS